MYKYPYGDSQQLNLDWILAKLKELEATGLGLDLKDVSKALISLPYNTSTAYRRYDYAFRNGKLYRCLTDTTGAFDPAAWQEALIGDDLSVLTRWINAIDAAAVVDVKFDTSGTNGKLQQKYHDQYHDVVEVDYAPVQNSKRPLSSNAGYELNIAVNSEKDELNAIHNNIIIEQGGIADATGIDADNEARLRNAGFLPPYCTITVAQPTPYDIRIKGTYYYDENNNFVQYLERNSYSVTVDNSTNPNGYKVRVSFWPNNRTDPITPSDLILSNYQVTDGIQTQIDELNGAINNKILYFASQAVSATTGNILDISNAKITADYVLLECTFAAPTNITTKLTWTTSAGHFILNGTCTSATTANVTLGKKGN